jgi:ATP-dependent DNA helicase RecQ
MPDSTPSELQPPEWLSLADQAPIDDFEQVFEIGPDPGHPVGPPRKSSAEPLAPNLDTGLRLFGHTEFRVGQREAVITLLESGRLLLVAPTGGGKSLTYQLPAALLSGTTLVI